MLLLHYWHRTSVLLHYRSNDSTLLSSGIQFSCSCIGEYDINMTVLRSEKRKRSWRITTTLSVKTKTMKKHQPKHRGQCGELDSECVEPSPLSTGTRRIRSCKETSTQAAAEGPRKRTRSGTKRNFSVNKATRKHRQQKRQPTKQFGTAILEIDHIKLPSHLCCSQTTSHNEYASCCAANRAARIAKMRAKRNANKTHQLTNSEFVVSNVRNDAAASPATKKRPGPKGKYIPDRRIEMSNEALQQWQKEQQKLRNRETAAAAIARQKIRVIELEREILDYKTEFAKIQRQIKSMPKQQAMATLLTETNDSNSCTIEQEVPQHRHSSSDEDSIIPSRFFEKFPTTR